MEYYDAFHIQNRNNNVSFVPCQYALSLFDKLLIEYKQRQRHKQQREHIILYHC